MDEILSTISSLFIGNGIYIILACMMVGMLIKGSFNKIPNKYIPFINIVLSVILGFLIPDTYADKDVVSKIIVLVFLGLSSVGLYEALCVIVKDRFSIDINKIVDKIFGSDMSDSDDEE